MPFKPAHGATHLLVLLLSLAVSARALDLRNAMVVLSSTATPRERQAARMLVEEVEKRSGLRWEQRNSWPEGNVPVIAVGQRSAVQQFAGPHAEFTLKATAPSAPEGFRLCVLASAPKPAAVVIGNDERGVLFGVGKLLRELHLGNGTATVRDDLDITTAPKYPLRGHQLGYRPKTHSYDAWDLPVWEQYFRDLAVFGCNAIELIPPRSDDDATSPLFPRPPMEMMCGMSQLADNYGLDVWIWFPALDTNYFRASLMTAALKEWGEVFAALPRVDALFVPGGDPGHTEPKHLMALLEKQAENLHRFHPKAQVWMSPQGFDQQWFDEFMQILQRDQPKWLTGIVHGPQVRFSPKQLRQIIPSRYPIRLYPDITHSRQCQYPVTQWDVAYSVAEGREGINPRPRDHAIIARHTLPDSIGFISYSEGCNDDVNKCLWSSLGWNPDADEKEVLREFSRYFIGDEVGESFADGLFALEQNWRGPLLANEGVEKTLAHFQTLERTAPPARLKNWRFQQALFRAYFDAYVRARLQHETALEQRANQVLLESVMRGSEPTIAEARKILSQPFSDAVSAARKVRIQELAHDLFESIRMQLSVKLYHAIGVDRGAMLDTLDRPLNNAPWLEELFDCLRRMSSEAKRVQALTQLARWTDPGPGGFYDDLGNVAAQPHLLPGLGFAADPDCFQTPRINFADGRLLDARGNSGVTVRRVSWKDHAEALYDSPLEMLYPGLDPSARYRLRVLYAGDNSQKKIQLLANDQIRIHSLREKPVPFAPLEFLLPAAATKSGQLKLTWRAEPGLGGNGRGCQVSEVWLIKEPATGKSK